MAYILPLTVWVYLRSIFFLAGSVKRFFSARVSFGRSRSSKVISFVTNRKRVCDSLLVCHSNLGPILHRFEDIAGCQVFVLMTRPHPYSTLILGMFPLDQIAGVGVSQCINLKLFGCKITFEVFQPMWSRLLNVTDRQTDRRPDGQTTQSGITALCVVSRGKNHGKSHGNHEYVIILQR